MDTIFLDGVRNRATIEKLKLNDTMKNYVMVAPLSGNLIFTQRTDSTLKGRFEFDAINADNSVMNITNGEFYTDRLN